MVYDINLPTNEPLAVISRTCKSWIRIYDCEMHYTKRAPENSHEDNQYIIAIITRASNGKVADSLETFAPATPCLAVVEIPRSRK